ncbi:MAG: glutathione peroxidase [Eubacteriales bacterium]
MKLHDFVVKDKLGNDVKLSDYEGKVLLIVNTATKCGFTPQYKELQYIYDKYAAAGFEILDFPCNQFGNQAPENDEEIFFLCRNRFGMTFRQFKKTKVKGEDADPLFRWLVDNTEFKGFDKMHPLAGVLELALREIDENYDKDSEIKWNFTKFLIDRNGEIVARFEPTASMISLENEIDRLIWDK